MLYLGRNEGVSVFYDLIERVSVRIPSDSVTTTDSGNCEDIANARWEAGELPEKETTDQIYRALTSEKPGRKAYPGWVARMVADKMPGLTRDHAIGKWALVGTRGIVVNSIAATSGGAHSAALNTQAIKVNYEVDNLGIGDSELPSFLALCEKTSRPGLEATSQSADGGTVPANHTVVKTIIVRIPRPCANPRLEVFFHDPVTGKGGEWQEWNILVSALRNHP
jgi:hypothetical protein